MKTMISKAGKLLSLAVLLYGLVGCSTATPSPAVPTQDPTAIMQSALQTAVADVTEEARKNPSPTPTQTETALPTQTPLPSPTATEAPTATPSITDTPTPTNTPTALPLSARALYTTTFPENKREYVPNEKFSLAIGFQNTGSVSWGGGYYVKMVGFEGEATVQQEVSTDKNVAPGGKIEFDLWAYGSETLGKHVWYFQLFTGSGVPVTGGYASFSYTSK